MAEGTILVSKTTPEGIITFCNGNLIKLSGYSENELCGNSHNIVRHPDTPAVLFEDLWATITNGEPWSGVIKNRTKNGDHYWVYANVTPIFNQRKIIGFMSVRTKPTEQQIEEAKKLFATLKNTPESVTRQAPASSRKYTLQKKLAALGATMAALQFLAIIAWASNANAAIVLGLLLLPLVPMLLGGHWINKQITRPLACISSKLQSLLEGNFFDWVDTRRNDEVGTVMKQLRMIQIKLGFDMVDSNDTVLKLLKLVAKLDQLSHRFQGSAASMEESVVNITKINSLVQNNAQNALDADHMSICVMAQVEKSQVALNNAVDAMSAINESTRKIADIITVIDEIAFKTNLLALNASVEAAHAGDQGKGFAVVADEVRSLSQHTTAAASEVKKLIEDSIDKVRDGSDMINLSNTAMQDVVAEVKNVSKLISQISISGKEQALGIEKLAENIQNINETLQHSIHLIDKTSEQSENIGKRAQEFIAQSRIRSAA
jgi:aerotaxis receptor